MTDVSNWILIGAFAAATLQIVFAVHLLRATRKRAARQSVSCAPEVIRPHARQVGACGVSGCQIGRRHSHVDDLVRRIKELP